MNIIKFKDIEIIDNFETGESNSIYNELFKGKYCFCVNMKWCVPFSIGTTNYIIASQKNEMPVGIDYILLDDYEFYIDWETTDRINNIDHFEYLNNFVSTELTLEQLKNFRTELATLLLASKPFWDIEYDETLTDKITSMLEYYKNNMTDCAIKAMTTFTDSGINMNGTSLDCGCGSKVNSQSMKDTFKVLSNDFLQKSTCGCNTNPLSTLLSTLSCDCIGSYRKSIYDFMVMVFSDYKFWKCLGKENIDLIIRYIAGILKAELPLNSSDMSSSFLYGDCSCMNTSPDEGNKLILNNLIKAFTYIKNDEVKEHKNFIFEALYSWSAKLYETMQW